MVKQHSMKFLVDESVEFRIVLFLRSLGFDVVSISEQNPSISDPEVLKLAYHQKRVLITNDKGFGRLIFKEKQKSSGVIFIRLPRSSVDAKLVRLSKILQPKHKDLSKVFTTISEGQTRSRMLPRKQRLKTLKP